MHLSCFVGQELPAVPAAALPTLHVPPLSKTTLNCDDISAPVEIRIAAWIEICLLLERVAWAWASPPGLGSLGK